MFTHIFRDSNGKDLFQFSYATRVCRKETSYFDVKTLCDISGFKTDDEGLNIDESQPYTIPSGKQFDSFQVVLTELRGKHPFISFVFDEIDGDDVFEVRVFL